MVKSDRRRNESDDSGHLITTVIEETKGNESHSGLVKSRKESS